MTPRPHKPKENEKPIPTVYVVGNGLGIADVYPSRAKSSPRSFKPWGRNRLEKRQNAKAISLALVRRVKPIAAANVRHEVLSALMPFTAPGKSRARRYRRSVDTLHRQCWRALRRSKARTKAGRYPWA